ncbi:ABC transporter substrate-binding protein [Pseudomonas sp. R5(2019)]|uniref:cytochrome c/ABC transporter substrate-binding protein n=1 Tax=Pseudomonas sp. R5(2019) TaxID=2697566 RepID=UPI0014127036|nr:ABC transporter substrate-binding protein [Pseudomonas sp. R5(2019)]NBA96739.1 ABC transporter substrate-binding protein [Pseudomonas sp. R5(2019)]
MVTSLIAALGLLVCLSGPAVALDMTPQELAGKRLYTEGVSTSGAEVSARVGAADMLLPGTALPCANCHGTDGRGRPEGGVRPPDITWQRLSQASGHTNGRRYPAYSEGKLARAVQEGVDPAGNRLDPAMPRFVLSSGDQQNLTAYLKRLSEDRDPGVQAEHLRLGTLLPRTGPLAPAAATVAAILEGSLARINEAGGIHGRQLQLVNLDPGPDQQSAERALQQLLGEEQVFALIAPLAPALDSQLAERLEQSGVPMVGAQSLLGNSLASPQIFEPLPGLREQLLALARYASEHLEARDLPGVVAYQAGSGQHQAALKLQNDLQSHGWQQVRLQAVDDPDAEPVSAPVAPVNTVFWLGDGTGFLALAEQYRAQATAPYLFAVSNQVAGEVQQLPVEYSRRVFLAYPFIPSDWTLAGKAGLIELRQRQGLDSQHALLQVGTYCSVLLLSEGLKRAGRDASREKLVAALEGLHDFATGLTPPVSFGPGKHQGLSGAHVVTVELPDPLFYPVAPFLQSDTAP